MKQSSSSNIIGPHCQTLAAAMLVEVGGRRDGTVLRHTMKMSSPSDSLYIDQLVFAIFAMQSIFQPQFFPWFSILKILRLLLDTLDGADNPHARSHFTEARSISLSSFF